MPFEFAPQAPQRIAVIGGGISGMGAAYLLSGTNYVTLFEPAKRLGGHARTVIAGKNGDQPVDTGFIVFNYENYPRMTRMFKDLDVPVETSNMSFGVSIDNGRMEYSFNSLGSVFAQKKNLADPRFYKMLNDIRKFCSHAQEFVRDTDLTVGQMIKAMGLGRWFKDYYLLPFSGAIWSSPLNQMMEFPADAMLRFFDNHKLLGYYGQHQWYTVSGGSIEYVKRIEAAIRAQGATVRTGAPVQAVRRAGQTVSVRAEGGTWEEFDRVVFACHSDTALGLLEEPTEEERQTLGVIRYQDNHSILHCDPNVMPSRKRCWSSWIYSTGGQENEAPVGVSYWMNHLQNIPHDDLLIGSLNPSKPIRDEMIYSEKSFSHPVFDTGALEAQKKLRLMQGDNNTWYCGAYMRNGFHEDGYSSAVDVAQDMGVFMQW